MALVESENMANMSSVLRLRILEIFWISATNSALNVKKQRESVWDRVENGKPATAPKLPLS